MPGFQIRTYRDDDLPALVRLINAADRVDGAGFATTEEALAHRLSMFRAVMHAAVYLALEEERLVGWVMLWARRELSQDRIVANGVVHPEYRRRGIGTELMRHVEEHARGLWRDRSTVLEVHARERVTGLADLAISLGMRPVRYFFYMECHELPSVPDTTLPEGMRLRAYRVGHDEEAFVAAYNDGFSDHWGYTEHTLQMEQHRIHEPGFRPEDTLLAVDAQGRIAGLCIVVVPQMDKELLHDNPPLVDDLAVMHAYRRRGLGRALLLAGMSRIRDLGFSASALAVDADNPNQALRLYESVGFQVVSRSTAFRKELA